MSSVAPSTGSAVSRHGERRGADWSLWTDDHLLTRIAAGEPEDARAAWAEFYRRHYSYLLFVCRRAYEGSLRPGLVEDLVHDTLVRAFERAASYDIQDTDPEQSRRRARAWLGGIAANLFRSELRRTPDFAELEAVEGVSAPATDGRRAATPRERALDDALDALSERERVVLRITFLYFRPESDHQRLPNAVAKALADELGISSSGLRKIRQRALEKVKSALEERGFPI